MAQVWFGIHAPYYFLCALGAFVLYSQMKSSGWKVIQFVEHFDAGLANSISVRFAEAILFSVIGGIVGTVVAQPTTAAQAIMAGLGWTGIVGALSERTAKKGGGET